MLFNVVYILLSVNIVMFNVIKLLIINDILFFNDRIVKKCMVVLMFKKKSKYLIFLIF